MNMISDYLQLQMKTQQHVKQMQSFKGFDVGRGKSSVHLCVGEREREIMFGVSSRWERWQSILQLILITDTNEPLQI